MGYSRAALLLLTLVATSALAGRHPEEANTSAPDVMVEMPAEVWSQGQHRQASCQRCCIYDNRSYTEGAVVKAEGVLLQCTRDEQSLGTNNLIWKIIR